jgi:hypothetical protein
MMGMIEHAVVDAGMMGGGAGRAARWSAFHNSEAALGVDPQGLDVSRAYTLRLVDHGVGRQRK